MNLFATSDFQFDDLEIHQLKEHDIQSVIDLFKLNYGSDYASSEFFDEGWYKRAIYGDNIIWLVLRDKEKVIASGAVDIGYGDNNDQIGMLGRLVTHPEYKRLGLARRIINALVKAAGDNIEFAVGEARTAHTSSQILLERSGFTIVGFSPQYYSIEFQREAFIIYARLYGNAKLLRKKETPFLIPEAVPLARYVLTEMNLPSDIIEANDCEAYPDEIICKLQPLENLALAELVSIKRERISEPPLFGSLTLDSGISLIKRRKVDYLVAQDAENKVLGAIGYKFDKENNLLKGLELIANNDTTKGYLCGSLLQLYNNSEVSVIEVNISAYDPRLQRTFYNYGFRPTAYQPAMVYHNGERFDVLKMLKLNIPYDASRVKLTESAGEVLSIVEHNFKNL